MTDETADEFALLLFEQSKRFLEMAEEETSDTEGKSAFLRAALLLAYSAFEAYLNNVATDFIGTGCFTLLEEGVLQEREVRLKGGAFELTKTLKMHRLEDRFALLYRHFTCHPLDKDLEWWGKLKAGLELRNALSHPRVPRTISTKSVAAALEAIISALDFLYRGIYKKSFPAKRRHLQSRLNF